MTVALDTSALLAIAVDGTQRAVVIDALGTDRVWCASAMALTEALPAIDRLTDEPVLRADLEDAIRLMWDHLHVVPVDQRCSIGRRRCRVDNPYVSPTPSTSPPWSVSASGSVHHLRPGADRCRPRARFRRGVRLIRLSRAGEICATAEHS